MANIGFKKTSEKALLRGRFRFHILENMAQNNNLNETSLKNNGILPKIQVFSTIFAKNTEKNPIYRTFQKILQKMIVTCSVQKIFPRKFHYENNQFTNEL